MFASIFLVGTLLVASPASASGCDVNLKYTAKKITKSTTFKASSGCDGVWARVATKAGDQVRGRFYKNSTWQVSSYGWTKVFARLPRYEKVIDNTVTGRLCKGQARSVNQKVVYAF